VAQSPNKYRDLGITHFILSDTPYLQEIKRQGTQLLPLLKASALQSHDPVHRL
jgi:alkanesulfonate monooxygenase